MEKTYYVEYNCKFIAVYKRLSSALKFIERKGLRNDKENMLLLLDNTGDSYSPVTGVRFRFTTDGILSRLTEAVSGTDKELYSDEERMKFAEFYLDKWDEYTSEDVIAEAFVDYWWGKPNECRRCSVCGKLMREGYCACAGVAYYCCDDCLHTDYTDEEWRTACEEDDQTYYTEWT